MNQDTRRRKRVEAALADAASRPHGREVRKARISENARRELDARLGREFGGLPIPPPITYSVYTVTDLGLDPHDRTTCPHCVKEAAA